MRIIQSFLPAKHFFHGSLLAFTALNIGLFSACAPTPCQINTDCPETQFCDATGSSAICIDGKRPTFTPVEILSFAFAPSPVLAGTISTLSWSTKDATACFLKKGDDGIEESVDVNSSQEVSAERTLSFTLRCEGDGADATQNATLVISRPVTLDTFTASATTVDENKPFTLSWASTNATQCTLLTEPSEGEATTADVDTTGELETTLLADARFTLTCNGEGGPVSESIAIEVWRILSFSVDDNNEVIAVPAVINFSFEVAGPSDCEVSGDDVFVSEATSASANVQTGETRFTLTCTGNTGDLIRYVTVYGLAIATFIANDSVVNAGDDVNFSWTAIEADECELQKSAANADTYEALTTTLGNTGAYTTSIIAESDFRLVCRRARGAAAATTTSEILSVMLN